MLYLVGIFFFLVIATFAYAGWSAAPWIPIRKKDVERAIRIAHIRPGERLYDLGCGDGRIVFAAGRLGAKSTGFEISILPYVLAKLRQWKNKGREGNVVYRDLWSASIHDADVVYLFLMPEMYPRLVQKIEREVRDGTRVITHAWAIPGWEADEIDDMTGRLKLFKYTVNKRLNKHVTQ